MFEFVGAEADPGGDDEAGIIRSAIRGRERRERGRIDPTHERPRSGCHAGLGAVLGLQAPLHDFELQRADGGKQRGPGGCVARRERLDHAFLQELLQAGAIFLGVG